MTAKITPKKSVKKPASAHKTSAVIRRFSDSNSKRISAKRDFKRRNKRTVFHPLAPPKQQTQHQTRHARNANGFPRIFFDVLVS